MRNETFPLIQTPTTAHALTIEAWVHSAVDAPETFQVLAASWPLRARMDAFASFDAGHIDGLDTKGYFGAVCDGRYVYFAPQRNGSGTQHGNVLRLDTHGDFGDPESWTSYDAGQTSGLNTKGYYGAVHTGDFMYFIPRTDGKTHHSRMLRYDARRDFQNPKSWEAYDIGPVVSYQSAAYDGRYLYLVPGYEADGSESGKAVRCDTQGAFQDPKSYDVYDAGHTGGLNTKNYDGACFDGRYVYYAPLNNRGAALRLDTTGDFGDPKSWQAFDAGERGLHTCVGAIFDGRYVYYVPYAHSRAVRYDTQGAFDDPANWHAYDATSTSGLHTRGYDGACFDGRYVYFIPFYEGHDPRKGFHCRVLRYDTLKDFSDGTAWDAADGGAFTNPPNPGGFNGGAFDGRYVYCAPWREDPEPGDNRPYTPHGKVLRYDTAGPGAAFVLKYAECGHNGGLGASLPGPTFTVNTNRGTRSARANRRLGSGWHHVVGVYDGRHALLYIDGALASETPASGEINIQTPIEIGRLPGGAAPFRGQISHLRVAAETWPAAQVKAAFEALRDV